MKAVTKMIWLIIGIILGSGIFFVLIDDADTRNSPEQSQPAGK